MESWVGLFREWKVMADSLYGEVIGVGNDDRSMLEWLGAQGFQEDSGPGTMRYRSKSCDMLSVLERLSVKSAEGIDDQDRRDLHRIDSMFRYLGEGGEGSLLNPRNIEFGNPVRWDGEVRVLKLREVYGHHRTDEYEQTQALRGRDRPAVPSNWHDVEMGKATPPIWQAMFGDGSYDRFSVAGLQTIISMLVESEHQKMRESGQRASGFRGFPGQLTWMQRISLPYWTYLSEAQRKDQIRYLKSTEKIYSPYRWTCESCGYYGDCWTSDVRRISSGMGLSSPITWPRKKRNSDVRCMRCRKQGPVTVATSGFRADPGVTIRNLSTLYPLHLPFALLVRKMAQNSNDRSHSNRPNYVCGNCKEAGHNRRTCTAPTPVPDKSS